MGILVDNKIHLALISETWLSSQSNSTTGQIKSYGYELIHVFREKRGGGVGILWKKDIQKYARFSSIKNSFDTFQYQIIIFNGTIKTYFVCIYRFQETLASVFFDELNLLIMQLDPCNPIIITGDFNFHFEIDELSEVKKLSNLMSTFGFSQCVSGPTHKRGHTLDLLFANENYFSFDNINPSDFGVSDHFPIFFDVPICPNFQYHTKKEIVYRDLAAIDVPAFSDSICNALNTAFENKLNNSTFGESFNTYERIVSTELNSIVPERTKKLHNLSTPRWIDGE